MWDATLAKSQAAREGQRLDVNPEVTAQAAPSRDPWVEAGPAQPSTARSAPGNWKLKRDGASRSEKRRCRRKGPRPVDLGQLLCSGEPEVKRAHRVSCCLQSVTEKKVRDRACLSTAALYTNVETQKLLKTGMKAHEHSCSAKVLPHSQPATGARRPNPTFCRDCQGRGLTWLCMSADRNSNFALQVQADLRMRWRTRPLHTGLTIPKGGPGFPIRAASPGVLRTKIRFPALDIWSHSKSQRPRNLHFISIPSCFPRNASKGPSWTTAQLQRIWNWPQKGESPSV